MITLSPAHKELDFSKGYSGEDECLTSNGFVIKKMLKRDFS